MSTFDATSSIVADRYRLLSELGRGGFGRVFVAVDETTGQRVALKMLHSDASSDARRRFRVEARALSRLAHPNCLRLLHFGTTVDGQPYLVSEFVEGETLRQRLDHSRIDVEQAADIAAQIAAALVAAHRDGIVHRDLKPSNVMLGTDGRVTVLDFGIARISGVEYADITKTGDVLGTPGYMSPEQLRGQRDIGPATDVYNLGLVAFAMFEGHPAFGGATPLEIGMAHLLEPAPPLTHAPPAIARLVASLLAKDPSRRPSAARALSTLRGDAGAHGHRGVRDVGNGYRKMIVPLALVIGAAALATTFVSLWPATSEDVKPRSIRPPRPPSQLVTAPADAERPEQMRTKCVPRNVERGERSKTVLWGNGLSSGELVRYVPRDYDPAHPAPLVIVFHDNELTAEETLSEWRLRELAEEHGILIVAPRAPRQSGPASAKQRSWMIDDQSWASEVLFAVERDLCIDAARIYLLSIGGGRNALDAAICGSPGTYAAVATSGCRFTEKNTPADATCLMKHRGAKHVPRLLLAGTDDRADPVEGGLSSPSCWETTNVRYSLDEQDAVYVGEHGCGDRIADFAPDSGAKCLSWDCDVPLVSCRVEGGRFQNPPARLQTPTKKACFGGPGGVDRTQLVWEFFQRHRRAASP